MSRLSKVIIWQTEKQTDTTEQIIYHAAVQVVNNNGPEFSTKKYNKFTFNFKHLAFVSSFVNKKAVFILELSTAAYKITYHANITPAESNIYVT